MSEGATFGAYRVVRKLGQGGMGVVYLGEHPLIGRKAAIKVLHRERSLQRENVERFFNEARATSAVEDPGIVQIYDFGVTTAGTAYLVMEYLDGEALSARLRRLGALHPTDAVRITRQIAGCLAAAHAADIVHRDLKPENVMLIRDGEAVGGERPKLLDFGIAKLGDERDDRNDRYRTRTGAVMGTPAYMSPEQCNDAGRIDARTDIYSLGCVLFHMLTGRPPFDHHGVGAMIAGHLREPPGVPSTIAPGVPAAIDPIVARCLAKQPEERFATMLELQQVCDVVLAQLPPAPPRVAHAATATATVRADAVTTLGTSVGESSTGVRPMRLGLWFGVAVAAITAGVVVAIATRGGPALRDPSPATSAVPAQPQPPPAAEAPEPTPAPSAPVAPAPSDPAPAAVAPPAPTVETPPPDPVRSDPPAHVTHPATPPRSKPPAKKPKPLVHSYEDRF